MQKQAKLSRADCKDHFVSEMAVTTNKISETLYSCQIPEEEKLRKFESKMMRKIKIGKCSGKSYNHEQNVQI